jgi:hypothetical protein
LIVIAENTMKSSRVFHDTRGKDSKSNIASIPSSEVLEQLTPNAAPPSAS